MNADLSTFSEPIASTSRAVFTLPYKAPEEENEEEQQEGDAFADPARLELYDRAWKLCNERIQTTLASLHDASLDQIVAFTHASPSAAKDSLYSTLSGRVPLRTGLIIGASPGSSSLLYSSLTRQLTSPPPASPSTADGDASTPAPCIVSRLSSRDCSNIKNALRSLIGGFVSSRANVEVVDEDEEDEEEMITGPSALKSQLLVPEDMLNLTAWYESRFGKTDLDTPRPTLAVLLEDLEAMDGKVLTQLLETLALYTPTLPLVLLIGIATTPDALYSLVPRKTANKLDAQSFFVDPGVGAFNALVRGVFVDWQPPLALGPKAYNDLWRTFEDLHHSIDATISFIQYLYMSHFTSHPLASLTLPPSASEDPSAPLPATTLATLRALPSLSSAAPPSTTHLPSLDADSDASLSAPLSSPSPAPAAVRAAIESCRGHLAVWSAERSVAFEALVAMMDFWEKRKPLEGVLGMVLGAGVEDGAAGRAGAGAAGEAGQQGKGLEKLVADLCGLVLQASSSKLPNFLKYLTSRLTTFLSSPSRSPSPSSSSSLLDFLTHQLTLLTPILSAPRPSGRTNLTNTNLAGSLSLPGFGGPGGLTDADREFSRVAKETSEGLRASLREALRPSRDLEMNEVWFTDDGAAMKRFHPTPLPTLFQHLRRADPVLDPSYQPPSPSGAAADPNEEAERVPLDLAVAYRTYAEGHPSGRLANLGEWFAAWELGAGEEPEKGAVMGGEGENGVNGKGKGRGKKRARREDGDDERDEEESDDDDEEEEDDDEGPARRKQARFLRALGDLAHLGLIHPTTYKPEHVLKSVY
ncbi:hypothetical protein JCM6882_006652 [Rhodosporidiobolus microsporus]